MIWATNQHIQMISEGSRDTEDWSNDAENSALNHRNKWHFNKYMKIENSYFILKYYFTILLFLLYFQSNKCNFGEQKRWLIGCLMAV